MRRSQSYLQNNVRGVVNEMPDLRAPDLRAPGGIKPQIGKSTLANFGKYTNVHIFMSIL